MLNGLTYPSPAGLEPIPLSLDHQSLLGQDSFLSLPSPDLRRPEDRQYTLEEAALILGQPYPPFLGLNNTPYPYLPNLPYPYLGNQQHLGLNPNHRLHKRPRLDTNTAMPTPYSDDFSAQDAQEKPSFGNQLDADRKPFGLTGWTAARLAECFFSMCPPCSTVETQHGT